MRKLDCLGDCPSSQPMAKSGYEVRSGSFPVVVVVGTPLSHMMSLIGSRLSTQSSRILAKSELCLHSLMIGYVSEVYPELVNGLSSAHTSCSRLQA